MHAWSGLGVRSERAIRRCVRCAAESRCAAAARSGIIGLTIRDSSCCHRMAAGIRQVCGRLSAARSCVCSAATTSGQRRAYRPNMPAPEFCRERPPLVFGKLGGHCSRSVSSHFRYISRRDGQTNKRVRHGRSPSPQPHIFNDHSCCASCLCSAHGFLLVKVCRSHRPRFFVCAHVFCEAAVKRVQIRERRPPVEERP